MKTRRDSRNHAEGGYALLMVLVVTLVCMMMLGATMSRTLSNAALNDRNNEYVAGMYAAEAATEKVVSMMKRHFDTGNLTSVSNNLALYAVSCPTADEDPYWAQWEFNNAQGGANRTYAVCSSALGWGQVASQNMGLFGWTNNFRVLSNAKRINSRYKLASAVQQDIQFALIPIFQFAIFYDRLLEFTWCAPMTINGRTHSNTNIFVGSDWDLTFNSLVTAGGLCTNNWAGYSGFDGKIRYNGGYKTNVTALTLPIGTNNMASAGEVIQLPPSGESATSEMGQQRYYNKAGVVLTVTATNVSVALKSTPTETPTIIQTNFAGIKTMFPFLTLTNNTFKDQRENDTIIPTDVDVKVLSTWLLTNTAVNTEFSNSGGVYSSTGAVPNIFYIADLRPYNSGSQLTAIRLLNAQTIPKNLVAKSSGGSYISGFTIASPNPVYVKGHYNCPNDAHLGTTNTTQTYPSSLVCDALTVLSKEWLDSESTLDIDNSSKNKATSTTVNAAIMAGVVYSTGSARSQFSGGVHNLPRLLENWKSADLTLNTSIVNLFGSTKATHQWMDPGVYYYAPANREFFYDQNFMDYTKLPPGTPLLSCVNRMKWNTPPPNVVNFDL